MNNISYLITDPKYYSQNSTKLKKVFNYASDRHFINIACLRDKKNQNVKSLAKSFLYITKKRKIFSILNSHIDLAYFLGFDGVHLPSNMVEKTKIAKRKKLFVIVSCHSLEEIKKAEQLKADMVTFSPVFYSPDKGKPKGLKKLRRVVFKSKIPIIALGGIVSKKQIHKIKLRKAVGFASIRYFVK